MALGEGSVSTAGGCHENSLDRRAGVGGVDGGRERADGNYPVGYTWVRSNDYSTVYNPNRDSNTNGVWYYVTVTNIPPGSATGLDSPDDANRWYKKTNHGLMIYYSPWSMWMYAAATHPHLRASYVSHSVYSSNNWQQIPLIIWSNPVPRTVAIKIDGRFRPYWGFGTSAPTCDVDFVIAKRSGGTTTVLFSNTYSKPTPNNNSEYGDYVYLDLPAVSMTPGDQIVYGPRARATQSLKEYVSIFDEFPLKIVPTGTVISILPARASAADDPRRAGRCDHTAAVAADASFNTPPHYPVFHTGPCKKGTNVLTVVLTSRPVAPDCREWTAPFSRVREHPRPIPLRAAAPARR